MVSRGFSCSLGLRRPTPLLLLLLLVQLAATQNAVCPHECIPVTECPQFMELLNNPTLEEVKILQKATCSIPSAASSDPMVCCPTDTTSPITSLLPQRCGQGPELDRIHGGTEVPLSGYPWMAVFGYSGLAGIAFLCGGSVINERYVLTAAHCVHDSLLQTKPLEVIRLGEWDLSTEEDCEVTNQGYEDCAPPVQDLTYEEIIIHPDYNTRARYSDDIALIRLSRSVDISGRSIQAVCLPPQGQEPRSVLDQRQAVVAGWGTTENGTTSDKMLHVTLPMVDRATCNATYQGILVDEQICFGGESGKDSCKGDSGGPLLVPGPRGPPFFQIGVVSYGPTICAIDAFPGVYTSVSYYRSWIEKNLKP
ncbi:CLIP domain-containing serine protease HP8-like [Panulirus ornatus]|uniref:CLIP domain-containing serine protease HP8-like n=1 Tax=Panulirus ornatus TaxID=150431 RepID=UPI003A8696A8